MSVYSREKHQLKASGEKSVGVVVEGWLIVDSEGVEFLANELCQLKPLIYIAPPVWGDNLRPPGRPVVGKEVSDDKVDSSHFLKFLSRPSSTGMYFASQLQIKNLHVASTPLCAVAQGYVSGRRDK